jgi:hypothetical protein
MIAIAVSTPYQQIQAEVSSRAPQEIAPASNAFIVDENACRSVSDKPKWYDAAF